ncbi:hypothetical protein ACOI1C_20350 [Bacillus sp. DJP31]|uniref:hypothetical protein n=1 Tax=Bacillus sp. DJP31 TaxID=3409789 RepID=UPI003BB75C64
MDKVFIEQQINQTKMTIVKLEKYYGTKETFRKSILMDAKSFLKHLQELKEQ